MKKITFLLFGLLLSISTFANLAVDTTKITTTERIVDKYSAKFTEGITTIVDKLEGPTVATGI